MSKPKDDWFKNAVWTVRNYPARKQEYEELTSPKVTASISGMPGGGGVSRTVENLALREMAPMKQKEYEAVTKAIEVTRLLPNGDLKVKLISLMYWQGKKLDIQGVVPRIPVAEATGVRWHGAFIRLVGEFMGYIS